MDELTDEPLENRLKRYSDWRWLKDWRHRLKDLVEEESSGFPNLFWAAVVVALILACCV